MEMKEIHQQVFEILSRRHQTDEDFMFSLRRSNRFSRLDKGYWFHGNEHYLAVSFWSGMDWKNKTPNIFFVIGSDGSSSLEISVSDSAEKANFVKGYLIPAFQKEGVSLNLHQWPFKIRVEFLGNNYINSLEKFIDPVNGLKAIIDKTLRKNYSFFEGYNREEIIDFIWIGDFKKRLENVEKYQHEIFSKKVNRKSEIKLRSLTVNNFGDIRNQLQLNIPKGAQWVFLTGENGSGKSTILKAIAYDIIPEMKIVYPKLSNAFIETKFNEHLNYFDENEERRYKCHGFAAYGSSRLMTTEHYKNEKEKTQDYYSLFEPDAVLLDIDEMSNLLSRKNQKLDEYFEALEKLEEAFNDDELFPQMAKVELKSLHKLEYSKYLEKDQNGTPYEKPVKFKELSSGTANIIALVGDMFNRLFEQLSHTEDPSELYGIVLIDEIDVHFHPAMQKKIVEILSANFPRVQFIVTTHSPVTLLGAPENSAFFRVERTVEEGVTARQIDIHINELTPNLILSSPIFGFSDLFGSSINEYGELRTEDSWPEKQIRDNSLKTLVNKYKDRLNRTTND